MCVLQLRVCACSSQCCRPAEWRCGQQLCSTSSETSWAQCASLLPSNLVSRRLPKLLGLLPLGRGPELLPTGHAASCCSFSVCRQPELDTIHMRHLSVPLDSVAKSQNTEQKSSRAYNLSTTTHNVQLQGLNLQSCQHFNVQL